MRESTHVVKKTSPRVSQRLVFDFFRVMPFTLNGSMNYLSNGKNKFYWLREASGGKYTPKIIFLNFSRSKIYVAQCRKTHRKKINIMKFNGLKGKKNEGKFSPLTCISEGAEKCFNSYHFVKTLRGH